LKLGGQIFAAEKDKESLYADPERSKENPIREIIRGTLENRIKSRHVRKTKF